MFIYYDWHQICKTISLLNKSITFNEILSTDCEGGWIAIKHDVETNVNKALFMARIEAKYNIRSTFYFQGNLIEAENKKIQKIASLGHEIAYHYDVMDANNGNIQAAIQDFQKNISNFNKYGFYVDTVCPHGNPVMIRNGWTSNKDFFRNKDVEMMFPNILDVVVQLPKKLKSDYIYLSDAGYHWKEIVNVQNNDLKNEGDLLIKESSILFDLIKSNKHVIISTHPHRWESSKIKSIINIIKFKVLRTIARVLSHLPLIRNIMSNFYYLAKKI